MHICEKFQGVPKAAPNCIFTNGGVIKTYGDLQASPCHLLPPYELYQTVLSSSNNPELLLLTTS